MATAGKITITRETEDIYTIKSEFGFWADGRPLNERVAFTCAASGTRRLSAATAQSIDRRNGNKYILLSAFATKSPGIMQAADALAVGANVELG